jgi:hypothetical protein
MAAAPNISAMIHEDTHRTTHNTDDLQRSRDQSHTRLVGAKEMLKEKLLHAVMQQAMDEVGDPESIATKIMSRLSGEAFLKNATLNLRKQMLTEITQHALEGVSRDVESTQEIAKSLVKDQTGAIEALKKHIMESIQDSALQSIADPVATAEKLSEDLVMDRTEILAVVEALRNKLHQDIARESLSSLRDVDESADRIHQTIDTSDERLLRVSDRLRELIGEEIGKRAVKQLGDADDVAHAVRGRMGENPEYIDELSKKVSGMLVAEAEKRAIDRLTGTGEVAEEVASVVCARSGDLIDGIVSRISESISEDIARRAGEALNDPERVAKSAKDRMAAHLEVVGPISERLRKMLLDEIAAASVEQITVEELSKRANALAHGDADVLAEIRSAVKGQIINDMVNNAIYEIRTEVEGAAQDFSHFASLVRPVPHEDDPEVDRIRQEAFGGSPDLEPAERRDASENAARAAARGLQRKEKEA